MQARKIKLLIMKLEQAKKLFNEIVEICYQTENPKLIEVVQTIYTDVENTKDVTQIIEYAEEFQICINEIDITPEEEEDVQEMKEKIELLSE